MIRGRIGLVLLGAGILAAALALSVLLYRVSAPPERGELREVSGTLASLERCFTRSSGVYYQLRLEGDEQVYTGLRFLGFSEDLAVRPGDPVSLLYRDEGRTRTLYGLRVRGTAVLRYEAACRGARENRGLIWMLPLPAAVLCGVCISAACRGVRRRKRPPRYTGRR